MIYFFDLGNEIDLPAGALGCAGDIAEVARLFADEKKMGSYYVRCGLVTLL